jgi:hypothetical protein
VKRYRNGPIVLFLLMAVAACGQAFGLHVANRTSHRPVRHRHFRGILSHPLFRPTHESLLRQNEEIDRLELPRIQDDAELEELKSTGALVPIRASETLRFDPRLDPSRRFCRPWARDFVEDLGNAFYNEFHASIQVNSAVRTAQVQKKLRRHNRNAAPESGETGSSHLAGITVDIQRRGLSSRQIQWVEQYMLPLSNQGLIEPEEERHQWVFHVMVSDRYEGWRESNVLAAKQPQSSDGLNLEPPPFSIISPQPLAIFTPNR